MQAWLRARLIPVLSPKTTHLLLLRLTLTSSLTLGLMLKAIATVNLKAIVTQKVTVMSTVNLKENQRVIPVRMLTLTLMVRHLQKSTKCQKME